LKNDFLEIFRLKVAALMRAYVEQTKIFIVENRMMGMDNAALKQLKEKEFSRWNFNREKLSKDIKREAAGLVNKLFITAYLRGIVK
jgi:hypothetical protein